VGLLVFGDELASMRHDWRMDDDDSAEVLGQWYMAEGNWWEATVRTEIASQLSIMNVELSQEQVDLLAWGVAVELHYRWKITPPGPTPPGFEPTVFPDDGIVREF